MPFCGERGRLSFCSLQPAAFFSAKAFDGVDDAFEDFELLVEAGYFQDFAVDRVRRGDFQIAVAKCGGDLAGPTEPSGRRCRAVRCRRDRERSPACDKPPRKASNGTDLVGAQFLGGMHDGDVAENFGGKIHGLGLIGRNRFARPWRPCAGSEP